MHVSRYLCSSPQAAVDIITAVKQTRQLSQGQTFTWQLWMPSMALEIPGDGVLGGEDKAYGGEGGHKGCDAREPIL